MIYKHRIYTYCTYLSSEAQAKVEVEVTAELYNVLGVELLPGYQSLTPALQLSPSVPLSLWSDWVWRGIKGWLIRKWILYCTVHLVIMAWTSYTLYCDLEMKDFINIQIGDPFNYIHLQLLSIFRLTLRVFEVYQFHQWDGSTSHQCSSIWFYTVWEKGGALMVICSFLACVNIELIPIRDIKLSQDTDIIKSCHWDKAN